MLSIFAAVIRYVVDRKGWGIPLIVCAVGIRAGVYLVFTPHDVDYPKGGRSPEYRRHMTYLLDAAGQAPPDFSKRHGGFLGSHLAIMDEDDFPRLAKKLRYEFRKAADDSFFFRSFVLGGMNVLDIDEPLLKAAKGLRISKRVNIEVVVVAPSTISAETQRILEKKGLNIRIIGPPSYERRR